MINNKALSIVFTVILFLFSCGGGHGTFHFDEISVYETNIQNNTQRLIKKIGVNEMGPHLIRYFNNSKKIIYSGIQSFVIIDESGKEETINLDSIFINDNFFSVSPDDKSILFGGKVILNTVDKEITSKNEGLYLYNIENRSTKIIIRDSAIQYPVFSNSGNLISYKTYLNGSKTALILYNLDTGIAVEISSNDFNRRYFSHFTDNDKKIVFVESGNILSYNIATQTTDTLIENIDFGSILSFHGQIINLYQDNLYFASIDQNPTSDWLRWNVSSFDLNTMQDIKLSSGMSPMAITEDYLLIRESRFSYSEPSPLKLIKRNGDLVFELEIGYSGDISFDNSSVVYIHSKKWEEEF